MVGICYREACIAATWVPSCPWPERLLDKDEIVDLVHRYSYCVDHRLHDELAELFTEDCGVDYGPGVRGRQAFRSMFGAGGEPTEAHPAFLATSHHNANVLITFDGDDRASPVRGAHGDVVVAAPDPGGHALRGLGQPRPPSSPRPVEIAPVRGLFPSLRSA